MMTEQEEAAVRAQNGGYLHAEAFCLMHYATDDGSETELIWNSRDGVTPFTVRSRSGQEMHHVRWGHDRRAPNFQPQIGQRMFVDLTPMRARILNAQLVEKIWSTLTAEQQANYGTKEGLIDRLTEADLTQPGQPDLIEVGP